MVWVSHDLLLLLLFGLPPEARALVSSTTASGGEYSTFPHDYPALMPALRDSLLERRRP